jgi:hypothetical protein
MYQHEISDELFYKPKSILGEQPLADQYGRWQRRLSPE